MRLATEQAHLRYPVPRIVRKTFADLKFLSAFNRYLDVVESIGTFRYSNQCNQCNLNINYRSH